MDLLLKKFSEIHFVDYLKLVSNIDVMAMITERAVPCDEASRDFKLILDENARHSDLGYYRIMDDKQGNFIGLAELGYMLLPEYWGLGIASKVATILVEQACRNPEISTLIAIIDPANLASKKILTNKNFITREFRDFDGLPGEILQRAV